MRAAVERILEPCPRPVNVREIQYVRVPEELIQFLGQYVGCDHRQSTDEGRVAPGIEDARLAHTTALRTATSELASPSTTTARREIAGPIFRYALIPARVRNGMRGIGFRLVRSNLDRNGLPKLRPCRL